MILPPKQNPSHENRLSIMAVGRSHYIDHGFENEYVWVQASCLKQNKWE